MESKKDDGTEKARFLAVRGEIYKRYTAQQKAKDQVASSGPPHSRGQIDEEADCGGVYQYVERSSAWKRFDL
jgi:hypothetical protein